MTITDFSPAGPEYWFVLPEYAPVDRLADDECPMDVVTEAEAEAWFDAEAAALHWRYCQLGIGPHPLSECPR